MLEGSNSQNGEAEKEVVFGGLGTEEELNQIDVKDRLVLVFVQMLTVHSDISISLARRKAYGVILATPAYDKQFESIKYIFKDRMLQKRLSLTHNDSINFNLVNWDTLNFFNAIMITNSQIKNIIGLSQNQLINLIENKTIQNAPITKVKVKFESIRNEVETANVIGVIKGKTDKTIVLSAHYDHLGKSPTEYFPGADDNAAGTAALLEIAEEFSNSRDLEYNLMFLATTGAEAGLLGSLYHVNSSNFHSKNILCNVNLEMISRRDAEHYNNKYLYCIGTDQSIEIDNLVKKADNLFDKCSFDFTLNNSNEPSWPYPWSDNKNFQIKGIPAILFTSGFHRDVHKSTDTPGKINFKNLENRVRLISLVIERLESEGFKN